MNAWVTLLTQPGYVVGVRTLRASLAASGSQAPLVVMVTEGIDEQTRRLLQDDGCLLRDVAPLRPGGGSDDSYANSRFAEVWTKLAVWGLTDFDRVVFLDADMLVTRNMDELLRLVDALQFNEEHGEVCPAGWNKGDKAMQATPQGVASYLAGHSEKL